MAVSRARTLLTLFLGSVAAACAQPRAEVAAQAATSMCTLRVIVALDTASKQGADDVLFQNTTGHAVCCATGNLFVLHGETLKTPPIADGVLPGIVRKIILDLAPAVRLLPVEASLELADLATADAVFTTNSLRLITPITALE